MKVGRAAWASLGHLGCKTLKMQIKLSTGQREISHQGWKPPPVWLLVTLLKDAMQAAKGVLSLSLSQLCYTTDQPGKKYTLLAAYGTDSIR